jgi:hypothetical protein
MGTMIDYHKNVHSTSIQQRIDINNWLQQIKDGIFFGNQIETLRNSTKGSKQYKEIKEWQLPCVTYNFDYLNKKTDDNVIGGTGFLFIDIDELDGKNSSFKIEDVDLTYVYSYYKSVGNNGYHIIINVNGLSSDGYIFKQQYAYILNMLNLTKYSDNNATKRTQYAILSYDSNIYINTNASIIDLSVVSFSLTDVAKKQKSKECFASSDFFNNISNNQQTDSCTPFCLFREGEGEYTDGGTKFISNVRFSNKEEIIKVDNDCYATNWDGWKIVECSFPNKIYDGNRHSVLSIYCYNLKWLNPTMPVRQMKYFINSINEKHCINPIDNKEINQIVYGCYGMDEIKPIYTTRKIAFGKNDIYHQDKNDKLETVRKIMAERKTDQSKHKLYEIIESWDFTKCGKITIRSIADNHPISKKTVAKYWSEVKDFVKELNEDHLEAISDVKKSKTVVCIN